MVPKVVPDLPAEGMSRRVSVLVPDTSVFVLDQPFEVVLDVGEVFAVVHVVALAGDAAAELLP